jgi:hypothetical protein
MSDVEGANHYFSWPENFAQSRHMLITRIKKQEFPPTPA